MAQTLHSITNLGSRRRRCLFIKLLRESYCNGLITRFSRTVILSAGMRITKYSGSLSSFCMISCFHIGALLTESARQLDLISGLGFQGCGAQRTVFLDDLMTIGLSFT